jgi:cell division transport system permease protein
VALPYAVREGLSNFRRAKFAAFASTSAMAVALVLIGLFGLMTYEAQRVSGWLRQRIGQMEIFIEEQATTEEAEALHARAKTIPGADSVRFISQAEAQEIFRREFGEGADVFEDEPFLPASVKVQMRPAYANPDSLTQVVQQVQTWDAVDEVVYNRPLLVKVQQNLQVISLAGLSLGLLVVIASVFLVGNTIRLTIYARRLLIRTMKLVGATDTFIRRPFLIEGALQGFIAGCLAGAGVWGLYRLLVQYLPQLSLRGPYTEYLLVGSIVLLGILLGLAGSYLAVQRFIGNVDIR